MTTTAARQVRRIVLQPGQFYFGPGPVTVETLLGSCLSLVLRNPESGFAAMSHCMLPRRGSPAAALATDPETYKYVDTCIATMLELMLPHGGLASLEVKVFGGADMFPTSLAVRAGAVGAQNASVAMELLQAPKLRVLRTDLGGTRGRQIRFDAETGEVFVRYLKAAIPVMA